MKHLILVRHAKSSWSNPNLDDIDRPLNDRGKRDAPFMAALMRKKFVEVDLLLVSPAKRARKTAKYFHKEFKNAEVMELRQIYDADVRDIENIILDIEDRHDTVLIFGHNPTFTFFANKYTKENFANLPTCGIVIIQFDGTHWSDYDTTNAHMKELLFPKQFIN